MVYQSTLFSVSGKLDKNKSINSSEVMVEYLYCSIYFLAKAQNFQFTPIDWTNCSTGAADLVIQTLEADPWPPTLGANITAHAKGFLEVDVSGGSYELKVKVSGIKVLDQKGNIADLGIPLPIPAGAFDQTITYPLPSLPVSGKVDATITVTDQNGNDVICAEIQFKPNKPSLEGTVDQCESVKDQDDCTDAVEADGDQCYWCRSAAVPSACYNSTIAKTLPQSIFDCGFGQVLN